MQALSDGLTQNLNEQRSCEQVHHLSYSLNLATFDCHKIFEFEAGFWKKCVDSKINLKKKLLYSGCHICYRYFSMAE